MVTVYYPDLETPILIKETGPVQVRVEAIPEPAILLLFGIGLFGILALARRKRTRKN